MRNSRVFFLTLTLHHRLLHHIPYVKLARWLTRSYNPFLYFATVFEVGLASGQEISDEEEDASASEYVLYSYIMLISCKQDE